MTATATTGTSLRERLATLLDYTAQGAEPPRFCTDCLGAIADRCDRCARWAEDFAIVNAAIGKIRQAADDTAALAVYLKTCMRLTGIFPGSAAILAATDGGEL